MELTTAKDTIETRHDDADVEVWPLKARGHVMSQSWSWVNDVYDNESCDEIVREIESTHDIEDAVTRQGKNDNVRVSQVAWVDMSKIPSLYQQMTSMVEEQNKQFWNFNLSSIEKIQYTVYDSKVSTQSRYDWHQDAGFSTTWNNDIRKLSWVVLLSDPSEFEGGKFQIIVDHDFPMDVEMQKGSMIFFPSPTVHRVTPVTKGVRKTLVGWTRGPCWI